MHNFEVRNCSTCASMLEPTISADLDSATIVKRLIAQVWKQRKEAMVKCHNKSELGKKITKAKLVKQCAAKSWKYCIKSQGGQNMQDI